MRCDYLIDRLVEKINRAEREGKWEDELPAKLRIGPPDVRGLYVWRIQPSEEIGWIEPLEARLPAWLPPSFRSLVTRYLYPDFDVQNLWLFANTGEDFYYEWRLALFADKHLSDTLLANGYIQFARPETGSYDPVCFDTNRQSHNGEYPIVQIDHEAILCYDRIGKVT